MKQRKVVSMIGALILTIGAVALITGCQQANNPNDDMGLDVKPTGKADPALKGTSWMSAADVSIEFAENGNIANISKDQALYTVEGEKIRFDLSSFIGNLENMTESKFIQEQKIFISRYIPQLEKEIKEAEKEGDEQKKKQLEAELKRVKEELQKIENLDEQKKKEIKQQLKDMHEYAGKMKAYAKFEGSFNSEKTQLTIEKFPYYDWRDQDVTVKKIVLKKE